MRRVELFGPPGVGKTTIYKSTMALRNSATRPFYNSSEAKLMAEIDSYDGQDVSTWKAFSEFVASAYAGCSGRKALLHARHLATRRELARVAALTSSPVETLVLLDESLCMRGISLALSEPAAETVVEDYFRGMPPADIVAVIVADEQTVSLRNIRRGAHGTGADRSAQTRAILKTCRMAAAILRARRIEVVELDGRLPPRTNAVELVKMMEQRH
jgi:adenylate kinase